MIYKANIDGIKLDVQSVNAMISNEAKLQIRRVISRLKRHIAEINSIYISLRKQVNQSTIARTIGMRVGIPATDVFVSASGMTGSPCSKELKTAWKNN
jgi:hypothetical protein